MLTSHSSDGHTILLCGSAPLPHLSLLKLFSLPLTSGASIHPAFYNWQCLMLCTHPHLPLSYLANRRIHRLPNYNPSILRIFTPVFHNVSVNAIFCAITAHHSGPGKHPEWRGGHASHNTPHPHPTKLNWGY